MPPKDVKNARTTHNNLTQWVDAFLLDRKAANYSPRTVDYYREKLGGFLAFSLAANVGDIEDITPDLLRRYLVHLEDQGHNPGGIHAHYRALRTFIRWWVRETEPPDYRDLFRKVKAPKVDHTPLPPVPQEDVQALLKTCGPDWYGLRDRAVILALLDTGARAAEFLALNVEDVNLVTGDVHIASGKGGKPRTVFLGKTARRAVRRYLGHRRTGALWTTQTEERLTYSGLCSLLRRRAAKAGIRPPLPHAFRRAFTLEMLRGGADLETVRRLLGHVDLQTVHRYLALLKDDLRTVHSRTSPADKLTRKERT
ncbi:MAG: hypothetical protein D6755_03600 [Anaerolineae bacterium]|nr:MAG: hypothetical protein D6755_03600 [Anaerolineae bacterium]